ncbi:MAG: hypothetical protein WB698_10095 [Solirubrobacteraceae bacterium]
MSQASPVRTRHHLAKVLHPTPRALREAMGEVEGINAKIAVLITSLVGTMWCAYLFTAIALIGLPTALKPGGEGIVSWIAQTFLQLVLLSVIMVGQNVQSAAADARSVKTFNDAETILDRLDIHTQGGLKAILDRLDEMAPSGARPGGLPDRASDAQRQP